MIHFHKKYVELAMKLMEFKSNNDDIKALNDVNEINFMINIARPTAEFIDGAKQLDKRINEDYSEIYEMHRIALNMANSKKSSQEEFQSEYDMILKNLNSDLYGILAATLLKHGKITSIKQFIESVD